MTVLTVIAIVSILAVTITKWSPKAAIFYVQGWTVCRKEPWMAVRRSLGCRGKGREQERKLCPGMDGQKFAPATSALPPSMAVVYRKYQGWRCGACDVQYSERRISDKDKHVFPITFSTVQ